MKNPENPKNSQNSSRHEEDGDTIDPLTPNPQNPKNGPWLAKIVTEKMIEIFWAMVFLMEYKNLANFKYFG